ncbi:hypothetical protein B7494_g8607 [Chlorociboria aeruginascens]|nr:hypothetical protein B7494_g8607 [Chlorociboria aeruginascens]
MLFHYNLAPNVAIAILSTIITAHGTHTHTSPLGDGYIFLVDAATTNVTAATTCLDATGLVVPVAQHGKQLFFTEGTGNNVTIVNPPWASTSFMGRKSNEISSRKPTSLAPGPSETSPIHPLASSSHAALPISEWT